MSDKLTISQREALTQALEHGRVAATSRSLWGSRYRMLEGLHDRGYLDQNWRLTDAGRAILAKQAGKPKHSPLPIPSAEAGEW